MPLGIQGDILCDRRAEVKAVRVCCIGIPTLQRVAFRVRNGRRADGAAVRNIRLYGMRLAADRRLILKRSGEHRCNPFCVDHDVVGGHGSGERDGVAHAEFIVVPASELVVLWDTLRARGRAAHAADIRAILLRNSRLLLALVHEHDVVIVAVIVEGNGVGIIGSFLKTRTVRQVVRIGEAGDRVMIFLRRTPTRVVRLETVRMVKGILFSVIRSRAGFSLQNLRIIIEVHGIFAVLIDIVERGSVKRHGVDAGLIRGRTTIPAFRRTPNL